MSVSISPFTGKKYGIMRVCDIWGFPRSTFYERKRCCEKSREKGKRGPKTKIDDEKLLALIMCDIEESPFRGEGHRKVWARLRFRDSVIAGKNRILRIMRENSLLSPHRRVKESRVHDGKIITNSPNVMWGTDGARVLTVDNGWVWIFASMEHWNAECLGWHVTKRGDRFAALEPISQGLERVFGKTCSKIGRGLSLRMDHGSQYTSDHFQNQIKYWGFAPSFSFVSEPQTNGVSERFFRTLKEQVIYGRIFQNVEEVRQAVGKFVELYNEEWLLEKNGFKSPNEARREYLTKEVA